MVGFTVSLLTYYQVRTVCLKNYLIAGEIVVSLSKRESIQKSVIHIFLYHFCLTPVQWEKFDFLSYIILVITPINSPVLFIIILYMSEPHFILVRDSGVSIM